MTTETTVSETKRPTAKTTFFDRAEIEGHVTGETMLTKLEDSEALGQRDMATFLAGRLVLRVLLDQGPGGFSLIESDIAPGTRVPRHKHNLGQVALVLQGSMRHGNKVLGPGAGYYTPPGGVYTFVTGPEGCRYVEFRLGGLTEITSEIVEINPERWVHES